jgi:hypothetical protein
MLRQAEFAAKVSSTRRTVQGHNGNPDSAKPPIGLETTTWTYQETCRCSRLHRCDFVCYWPLGYATPASRGDCLRACCGRDIDHWLLLTFNPPKIVTAKINDCVPWRPLSKNAAVTADTIWRPLLTLSG